QSESRQYPDHGRQGPDRKGFDPHHLDVSGDPQHPGHDADHPAPGTAGRIQDRPHGVPGKGPRRFRRLYPRHFQRLCRRPARRLSRCGGDHRVQRRRAPQERQLIPSWPVRIPRAGLFICEAHVSTLTHTNGRLTSTTREERLLSFNARYRQQQFTRRNWTLLYGALFLAALSGSVAVSDFSIPGLIKGLPMAWNYIAGTLPTLTLENFWADLADWYWGLRFWLRLLVETILMGFVGTVLGGGVALLLCFPASRNLVENTGIYFAARRSLEFLRTVP